MDFGKERRETPRGGSEGAGRKAGDRRNNPGLTGGFDDEFPEYPREIESIAAEARLKNPFRKVGQRLAFSMSDTPTQPQELYWLSRQVERLIDIVEDLAAEVEKINRERAVEKAADAFEEKVVERGRKKREWLQRAILGVAIGTVGYILREIVAPILAHLRR